MEQKTPRETLDRKNSLNDSISTSRILQSSPYEDSSNQNLTAILNVPVRNQSLFQQLFQKLASTLFYKYQKFVPTSMPSEQMMQRIAIDGVAFNQYREQMRIVFDESKHLKKELEKTEDQEQNKFNLSENLLNCFKLVPEQYFDDSFFFDFKNNFQSKNIPAMNDQIEDLQVHLDEVQINLFYQINTRFNDFLDVILNLNSMQTSIDQSLDKVAYLQNYTQNLKKNSSKEAQKIVNKQKKILNLEKTISLMELLQTVHQTVPTINQLIDSSQFDYAVSLLHDSEETYDQKFKQVKALKQYSESIYTARQQLEQHITSNFQEKSLSYVSFPLAFIKNRPIFVSDDSGGILNNSSFLNETFDHLSSSRGGFLTNRDVHDDIPGGGGISALQNPQFYQLTWSHQQFSRDDKIEEIIAKIVIQSYHLIDFSARNFRVKLMESLKIFSKNFLNDMYQYSTIIVKQQELALLQGNEELKIQGGGQSSGGTQADQMSEAFNKISAQLFLKFISFYSEQIKRLIFRQLTLNQTIITNLLISIISRVANQSMENGREIDDNANTASFNRLGDLVEEFYSVISHIFKFLNDKLLSKLGLRSFQKDLNLSTFIRLTELMKFWMQFLTKELAYFMTIDAEMFATQFQSQKINEMIQKFNNNLNKINMNPVASEIVELSRQFFQNFHKKELGMLKETLEADMWHAVDVPFDFYDIFMFLMNEKASTSAFAFSETTNTFKKTSGGGPNQYLNTDRILDESTLENQSLMLDQSVIIEQRQNQEVQNQNKKVQIMKNFFFLQLSDSQEEEAVRFKVTNAGLQLLQKVSIYLQLMQYFPDNSIDIARKLIQLLKFYNSYSTQLIIGAGFRNLKNTQTITSKHIAMSSLCLELFIFLSKFIKTRLTQFFQKYQINGAQIAEELNKVVVDFENHNNQLYITINRILTDRIERVCQELSQIQWNATNVKFNTPTKSTAKVIEDIRNMYTALEDLISTQNATQIFSQTMAELCEIYLNVFKNLNISSQIAAKRVKDELQYIAQDLNNLGIIKHLQSQQNLFDNKVDELIHTQCINFLDYSSAPSSEN